ncbi:MAG: threonine--tRNA ligase [Candidatus Micrarchaeia archaeon]
MRILTIHADYIEVEALKKAIADAEELKEKEKKKYEEVLVVFTAVEQGDEDIEKTSNSLTTAIIEISNQLKTKNILLYPLVHLTSKPSAPRVASKVIQKTEELLKKEDFNSNHSPFGWYKGYTLKCKGHPLSELSRELKAEGDTGEIKGEKKEEFSKSLKEEEDMKSRFCILTSEGELIDCDKFNYKGYEELKKLVEYETKKIRAYETEPPHIKLMKEQKLVDYEPGSDSGNFRFYPNGRLIKKLLERKIDEICINFGAMEVETPVMYDFEHPTLKKYLNRFPARQYTVLSDDKKLFLRFSACFGQFLMSHDMVMSYKHLPLKMYELTRYSFRREQGGELAGLKRLRSFTMPDMHTLCADTLQAQEAFEQELELGLLWIDMLSLKQEVAFRVLTEYYDANKEWYKSLVKKIGKPALIELFPKRYAYFVTKFEFNFVDNMNKASTLTTVQIDVENAETYDINYIDAKGEKKRPLILHASISGSIERVIYALLENEASKMKRGEKAMLPLWICPTQIRIIPVNSEQLEYCKKLMENLENENIRVDLDDREESLGKKIREAEKNWIPYTLVIGKNEVEEKILTVRIRESGKEEKLDPEKLVQTIKEKTKGMPFERLSLPNLLSRRPIF